METATIEFRCQNCDEIHTITFNGPGMRVLAHIVMEIEVMIFNGINDFRVYDMTDMREDITSGILNHIVNSYIDGGI